jgi:hypothetical protein
VGERKREEKKKKKKKKEIKAHIIDHHVSSRL